MKVPGSLLRDVSRGERPQARLWGGGGLVQPCQLPPRTSLAGLTGQGASRGEDRGEGSHTAAVRVFGAFPSAPLNPSTHMHPSCLCGPRLHHKVKSAPDASSILSVVSRKPHFPQRP